MLGSEKVGKTSIGKNHFSILYLAHETTAATNSMSMSKEKLFMNMENARETNFWLFSFSLLSFVTIFTVSQFMTSEYLHAYDTSIGKFLLGEILVFWVKTL